MTKRKLLKQLRNEIIDCQNKIYALEKELFVNNYFANDKYLTGEPDRIRKEDAVEFEVIIDSLCMKSFETYYCTQKASKFYKSLIDGWKEKVKDSTLSWQSKKK